MQFWPSSPSAVEDRQDLGLEVGQVEPVAGVARAALERPRDASRALAISRCRSAVFVDCTSSRRPFSIAALATSAGWLLDQLEGLLADAAVLVDQGIAHDAEQRRSLLQRGFGGDPLEQGDPRRGRRIVEGLAQQRIRRSSPSAPVPGGSRRPDLRIAVAKAPLDRLVHGPLGPESRERPQRIQGGGADGRDSRRPSRERTFAAGSSFGSTPATGPSRPMNAERGRLGVGAGLGQQLVDQRQRRGIGLAAA